MKKMDIENSTVRQSHFNDVQARGGFEILFYLCCIKRVTAKEPLKRGLRVGIV